MRTAAHRLYAGVCFWGGSSAPWRGGRLLPGGCLLPGGVSAPGGCLLRGVWSWGGVWYRGGVVSQYVLRQTPLWTEWMTDRCKNITLATTSFRPLIIGWCTPLCGWCSFEKSWIHHRFYYRLQHSCGKVMFYTCLSLCSQGDRQTPTWQADPPGQTPLRQADTPPPGQPLQRTVRILLECIIVINLK